jgi:hypothetical protein
MAPSVCRTRLANPELGESGFIDLVLRDDFGTTFAVIRGKRSKNSTRNFRVFSDASLTTRTVLRVLPELNDAVLADAESLDRRQIIRRHCTAEVRSNHRASDRTSRVRLESVPTTQ